MKYIWGGLYLRSFFQQNCFFPCIKHPNTNSAIVCIFPRPFCQPPIDICVFLSCWWQLAVNSLWPSNAIRRQGIESTLAQVMACCLTTPSHYLNQCWLISKVLWHSLEALSWEYLKILISKTRLKFFLIASSSPSGQRVNVWSDIGVVQSETTIEAITMDGTDTRVGKHKICYCITRMGVCKEVQCST